MTTTTRRVTTTKTTTTIKRTIMTATTTTAIKTTTATTRTPITTTAGIERPTECGDFDYSCKIIDIVFDVVDMFRRQVVPLLIIQQNYGFLYG